MKVKALKLALLVAGLASASAMVGEIGEGTAVLATGAVNSATIGNAKAFLRVQEEFGSFDIYIWRFVNGTPVRNAWNRMTEIPCRTPASGAMSADLRKRGFRFVGPTICYAFMQAVGMVNDHVVECFRYGIPAR